MSRNQKLIVIGMAVIVVILLCVMGGIVVFYTWPLFGGTSPPAIGPSPVPSETPIPTWTPSPTPTPGPTFTPTSTRTPTPIPPATSTFGPTDTPTPTSTPTPTPKPLENATFDDITPNNIPGWETGAYVNWHTGEEFDPVNSFAEPRFHKADNPDQRISGSTLQIDTVDWVKLQAWVYQSVDVGAGSRVLFEVSAAASLKDPAAGYYVKVGIDPDGGEGCDAAQWGAQQHLNQKDGVVTVVSPWVTVGDEGRVTVCIFAETQYAQAWHAVFFDNAVLTIEPKAEE